MFTYHLPAIRSSACASVSVALPSKAALSAPVMGTTTGPFLPASPAWKCAAVAGPVRPDTLPFHVSCLLAVSKVAVTEPLALLSTGGTSFEALRSAFRLTMAAMAGRESAIIAVHVRAAKPDRANVVLITAPPFGMQKTHCKEGTPFTGTYSREAVTER